MEQRNLFIAIALSIAILIGFQYFFEPARRPPTSQPETAQQQAQQQAPAPTPGTSQTTTSQTTPQTAPATAETPPAAAPNREAAIEQAPRIKIDTPRLHGSISLVGARIDDVTLAQYHETIDPKSPEIVLLSPPSAPHPYFAEFGWLPATANPDLKLPGADTRWQAQGDTLAPGKPVTLTWDNGQGLRFERTYEVDQNYMFTIRQRVTNTGSQPIALLPYGFINRTGTPPVAGYAILHEGPLGVFDGTLKEVTYAKLPEGQPVEQASSGGGWLGITDKYWLAALVPDRGEGFKGRFTHTVRDHIDRYQTDFLGQEHTVPPGGSAETSNLLFAGAKEFYLLRDYRDRLGITNFDLAIDFGYLWFLTKPIFQILDFFARIIGNFGIAILLLTVLVKLLFFPLANKSYKSMSKLKLLQPEMTKLRERFGEDKARLNQEMMALYKRSGANPMSGCLPIVIQIPVFFSLYKVLFVTIEMRHAPFFGWVHDLSAPDPTTVFNLFGLIPWHPPAMLMIGAWPLIMGVTMYLQQRLNPQPADPVQAKMFMFLPIIFTYMLAAFPVGLVIYWAWNNTLSVIQQWVIMHRSGAA